MACGHSLRLLGSGNGCVLLGAESDVTSPQPGLQNGSELEPLLLWERLEDTLIAAALVAAVSALFFPRQSWSSLAALAGRASDANPS